MPALRVAIVAPSLDILGGQAVQADRLLRAWDGDSDVRAWLVPINPRPPGPLRLATRIKFLRTLVTEATYLPSLVRGLRHADIVHVFSASYFSFLLAPLPAVAVARLFSRPVVLNYHSGEAPDHLSRSAVARTVLRLVERIVVPSQFLKDVFGGFGLDATVVPNTIDCAFTFRERKPLRPRILSTRNFSYPYNVACTLQAFRLVQRHFSEASLTLVGSGPEEGALRDLATSLRLANVSFVGRVEPAEIHRFYADHDIYLQSPDIDNAPLSVIEAFASGLPVVSTEAGGIPAILEHGQHGLLAPVGDWVTLARHVERLLSAPDRARGLAREAYAACAHYQWQELRPRWLDVYQTVQSGAAVRATAQTAPANGRSS